MDSYRISKLAAPYLHHDMITKYTKIPEFPHLRTNLLHAFLRKGASKSVQSSDLHALVTSLLQLGLDTHDKVENGHGGNDLQRIRARQLKVLAGDYFSGRFYYLLSQAEQIELVRKLSQAVCDVNQMKVNMYMLMQQLKCTADQYLQISVTIKSRLFLGFSHLMEGIYQKEWPTVLQAFTRCELIAAELERLDKRDLSDKQEQAPQDCMAYWYVMERATAAERERLSEHSDPSYIAELTDKYEFRSNLLARLEEQIQVLRERIGRFQSGPFASYLRQLGDRFQHILVGSVVPENMTR